MGVANKRVWIRCESIRVYDKDVKGPEYETVGLFGANIESADLDVINETLTISGRYYGNGHHLAWRTSVFVMN